ncbi:hypothetical protein BDQ12DRAFT_326471 [Crucibulum laeve]|uniref:DUF6533 domain-containing protein n=1 Tax=Crucibulum laeve TaxID=68775 RepID=A0A5C3M1Z1_9AGAR|nr:hypothetical protein BDQ12DRAFT_326471 [Crucibulum laeve]
MSFGLIVVATCALLANDWLFTIGDEINYIWPGPWNMGKVLFFLTRYPAFADSALTLYHNVAFSLSAAECTLNIRITEEFILTARVWALYDRSRSVTVFLVVLYVLSGAASTAGLWFAGSVETFLAMDLISPSFPGCYPRTTSTALFIAIVVLPIDQTVIFLMTLLKAIKYRHEGTTSFVKVFFCDGIMYYITLQLVCIGNWVGFFLHIEEFLFLYINLQRAMHAILSARILIHLRREAIRNVSVDGVANSGGTSVGVIAFANPSLVEANENSDPRRSQTWSI